MIESEQPQSSQTGASLTPSSLPSHASSMLGEIIADPRATSSGFRTWGVGYQLGYRRGMADAITNDISKADHRFNGE